MPSLSYSAVEKKGENNFFWKSPETSFKEGVVSVSDGREFNSVRTEKYSP